jgi:hypothetical protein
MTNTAGLSPIGPRTLSGVVHLYAAVQRHDSDILTLRNQGHCVDTSPRESGEGFHRAIKACEEVIIPSGNFPTQTH